MAELEEAASSHSSSAAIRIPMLQDPKPKPAHPKLATEAAAEFAATFFLCFTIGALSITNERTTGGLQLLSFAMCAGFTTTVIIFTTGHISGAHINPSITFGFALARRFPWSQVPVYIFSQIIGSTSGILAAKWIYNFPGPLALTTPLTGPIQSFAIEAFMTFLIMFLACTLSTNSKLTGNAAAIAVPAGIGLSIMVAGPVSGASLNPARSLGPAIIANFYSGIWIYITAPLLGSALAVATHKAITPAAQ